MRIGFTRLKKLKRVQKLKVEKKTAEMLQRCNCGSVYRIRVIYNLLVLHMIRISAELFVLHIRIFKTKQKLQRRNQRGYVLQKDWNDAEVFLNFPV